LFHNCIQGNVPAEFGDSWKLMEVTTTGYIVLLAMQLLALKSVDDPTRGNF
jgi:hypothetical protein